MAADSPMEFENEAINRRLGLYITSPDLLPSQREDIQNFKTKFCVQRKQRPATQESYIRYIHNLGRMYKKDYREITEKELAKFFESLDGKSESLQDWAKLSVKMFYRWLLTGKTTRHSPYPELVAWLKITKTDMKKIKQGDCFSLDDYKKMLGACKNQRDRALIAFLFETGARISEVLSLRIKNIHLDTEDTYADIPDSKTDAGIREVGIADCVQEIVDWLKIHPNKSDKDSFLFPNIKTGSKKQFMERKVALYTIQRIAARAKLKHDRIYNHLFRHSRATLDRIEGMSDQYMWIKYGWSQKGTGSRMTSRYAHITSKDVRKWERKVRGLPVKEDSTKAPQKCPRCKAENTWERDFCRICFTPLSAKIKLIYEEREKERDAQLAAMQKENAETRKMLKAVLDADVERKKKSKQ